MRRDQFLAAVHRMSPEDIDRVTATEDVMGVLLRMARKTLKESDADFLSQVAIKFICAELDWARCWGVPSTPESLRVMQRNFWLCEAARHVETRGLWTGPLTLHAAWERFVSRGPWRAWRDDADPPEGASPLDCALFWATRWNRGDVLGEKALSRIVRREFESKSP